MVEVLMKLDNLWILYWTCKYLDVFVLQQHKGKQKNWTTKDLIMQIQTTFPCFESQQNQSGNGVVQVFVCTLHGVRITPCRVPKTPKTASLTGCLLVNQSAAVATERMFAGCEDTDAQWPGSHRALQLEKGEDILHSQSCHMTDATTATLTHDTH